MTFVDQRDADAAAVDLKRAANVKLFEFHLQTRGYYKVSMVGSRSFCHLILGPRAFNSTTKVKFL